MKQAFLVGLRKYLPVIAMTVLGLVGGYLYYRFVGCASGTCAITSNPILSAVYGGLLGGLVGSLFIPRKCRACGTNENKEDHHA